MCRTAELQWADRYAPAEVRRSAGHCRAASLDCQILPGGITRSRTARLNSIVVGTAATTLFGSDRLPVKWLNGVVSQLPLPPGETLGDANSVNFSGIAVGSVDAGSNQRGAVYLGGGGEIITANHTDRMFFRHRVRHQRLDPRPHRGPGDRSKQCRAQRWDRL